MFMVSIDGPELQGFLLQARHREDGRAVGRFVDLQADVKYQNCQASKVNKISFVLWLSFILKTKV